MSATWPLGRLDTTASRYWLVEAGESIAGAFAHSIWGDIVVLSEGTYTEDITVPAGVTLRAAVGATVTIVGLVAISGTNTFRDIKFDVGTGSDYIFEFLGDHAWFEHCTLNSALYGAFTPGCRGDLTFNRCLFIDDNAGSLGFDDIATLTTLKITSCVFNTTAANGLYWYPLSQFLFLNNTACVASGPIMIEGLTRFLQSEISSNLLICRDNTSDEGGINVSPGGPDIYSIQARYNYGFGFSDTWLPVQGIGGISNTNKVYPMREQANVVDLTNRVLSPRDETPGKVTLFSSFGPVVDYNGMDFATDPSVGAIQYHEESTSLYRPWFDLDILSGFNFNYSALPTQLPVHTSMGTDFSFYSHLEVVRLVNAYIQDAIHPSRGVFSVNHLGKYRLRVFSGTFDLNLSGDAATIFGSGVFTGATDTG